MHRFHKAARPVGLVLPAMASAATQTLTIEKKGSGTGTVTSSPAGIECGSTCSASFLQGEVVALTAVSGPGSGTVKWSGCGSMSKANAWSR